METKTVEQPNTEAVKPPDRKRILWDDTDMRSVYANVFNAVPTQEEIIVVLGTNQTWHAAQKDIKVKLTDRLVLSPHAAKRLSALMSHVVADYESKFGPLDKEAPPPPAEASTVH